MTLIPFSRPYILLRWTLGWVFNAIFYIFLSALVINALYPPILLQCESRLLQRIAPAFIDVA